MLNNFKDFCRISFFNLYQCIKGWLSMLCSNCIFIQVVFNGCDQDFIAAQAPKKNMFSGFWQLVLENDVSVIGTVQKFPNYYK